MAQAANYRPGSFSVQPAGYNFVSVASLIQRDVDPKRVKRYGTQLLVMLDTLGYKLACDKGLTYEHYEDDRIMPKMTVQTAGASAGAACTFTLSSTTPAQQFAQAQYSPYVATSPTSYVAGIPVRPNDIIMIKPSSGVSGSTVFQALVVSVNPTAGTFVAIPHLSSKAIPAMATDTEIIIVGKAFGAGSAQAQAMVNLPVQYTNSMQIMKEAFEIDGTLNEIITYASDGKSYMLKGEEDTFVRMQNYKELALLLGEGYNNTNIANQNQLTPISMTVGLIPTILSNGVVQGYSTSTGFGVNEIKNLVVQLDTQKGSMENILKAGIDLSMNIDTNLGDYFKNGAISYGFFGGEKEKAVDFQFQSLTMGNYTFHKSILPAFSDLQTLGADGYTYRNEAIVIPAEAQSDRKSGEKISSLRIRFQPNREMKVIHKDLSEVGDDGRDVQQVTYSSTCGLEVMGANRFAYIKVQ